MKAKSMHGFGLSQQSEHNSLFLNALILLAGQKNLMTVRSVIGVDFNLSSNLTLCAPNLYLDLKQ